MLKKNRRPLLSEIGQSSHPIRYVLHPQQKSIWCLNLHKFHAVATHCMRVAFLLVFTWTNGTLPKNQVHSVKRSEQCIDNQSVKRSKQCIDNQSAFQGSASKNWSIAQATTESSLAMILVLFLVQILIYYRGLFTRVPCCLDNTVTEPWSRSVISEQTANLQSTSASSRLRPGKFIYPLAVTIRATKQQQNHKIPAPWWNRHNRKFSLSLHGPWVIRINPNLAIYLPSDGPRIMLVERFRNDVNQNLSLDQEGRQCYSIRGYGVGQWARWKRQSSTSRKWRWTQLSIVGFIPRQHLDGPQLGLELGWVLCELIL